MKSRVMVKETHIVKPAEDTPKVVMHISQCDQVEPIIQFPTVYFYRSGNPSIAHTLKDALSKALVIFYPLAGRLHPLSGDGSVDIHCNSEGALLLEADSESEVNDYGDFRPTPELLDLIPTLDPKTPLHERPLLLVKLTRFACGGVALGMAVSHVLVDGLSGLHFVNVWATIARGEQPSRADMPFLDRNVLQQRIDVISDTGLTGFPFPQPPLLIGKSGNLEEREKPTNLLVLKLTKQNIDKLREIANEGGAKYSRFEVVAGHIWRCATEARRHRSEQPTNLYVRVDFRSRLNPPLPPHYFGNAIIQAAATALSGELLRNGLGYAAGRIREAVMSITDEYVRKNLAMATQIPDVAEFYGNPNMTITSWINLPLHRTDFGWGKEVYMGPGLVRGDGKSFIMPLSGDGDDNSNGDDGTLRVLLCLQQQYVEAFEDFFYEHF